MHESESALSRGGRARSGGASVEGFASQSSGDAPAGDCALGRQSLMALYDVDEMHVRVADPALGLRKIPRKEFEQKCRATRRCLITRLPSNRPGEQTKPGLGLPFLAKFRKILLQVLGLAVAVSFLQLLFPVSPRWWWTR